MLIHDIMSGNLQALQQARVQKPDDIAGLAVREITRAEIKSLDTAASAAPEIAQAAPVAPEQTTGGIVNTLDSSGISGRLTDMANHTAAMMNNMSGSSAAAMSALSTNNDISSMIQRHFGGLENSLQNMADPAAATADLSKLSQKFQTAGELSLNSASFNANQVAALLKNGG